MTQPIIESLEAFRQWFLSPAGPGLLRIPLTAPIHHKDELTGLTLYRRNGYQAELCLIQTNAKLLLKLPDDQTMIALFLGGSLHFDVINSPNLGDYTMPSPDECLHDLHLDEVNQHTIEAPHPLMLHSNSAAAMSLHGGTELQLHSSQKDGILLLFTLTQSGTPHIHTNLDYMSSIS